MKDWTLQDLPANRLINLGSYSLSDAELLSIIVGDENVCREILKDCKHNFNELAKWSFAQLSKYKGIGTAKATALMAVFEIGRRRTHRQALELDKVTCSNDVANYLRPLMGDLGHECFFCLFMNRQNKIIDKKMLSEGGITGTVIDVRRVFAMALEKQATSIIVAHNHPSGNLDASESDRRITRQLKEAGAFLEIPVLDHLIITQGGYMSFADEGLL